MKLLSTARYLDNFGHSLKVPVYLLTPGSLDDLGNIFTVAKKEGISITLRGAGRSYNDASLNAGGIVLDLQRLNHILEWDNSTGIITVESGVTIRDVWQKVLPDGWWPPVVSGTMTTTLGGCLGTNIHGKNNFKMGTIGEHVHKFTALLPSGEFVTCSLSENEELFKAMIGGLGLLGVVTTITLQMKRIFSGFLQVQAWNVPNIGVHLADLEYSAENHSYAVGWMDLSATGKRLGRGQLHAADYLEEGEDPDSSHSMELLNQKLPERYFGIIPKSLLPYLMTPLMNNPSVQLINTVKYFLGRKPVGYRQCHAAFHFLLDYIPNWEKSYGQLIQYQSFLPKETAFAVWTDIINTMKKRGILSYLGVTKRHRPDGFLLTHGLDGFSLAMDFKVTNNNRDQLKQLFRDIDTLVIEAGGRFYFAKNCETDWKITQHFLGKGVISKFNALKKRCDPNYVLESDLSRRILVNQ